MLQIDKVLPELAMVALSINSFNMDVHAIENTCKGKFHKFIVAIPKTNLETLVREALLAVMMLLPQ